MQTKLPVLFALKYHGLPSLGEVTYFEVLFFNYEGSGVGSNLLSEICPHFQESLADTY